MRLTEKADRYIRKHYLTKTNRELARKIGCDCHTIADHLKAMGLQRPPKINEEWFRANYPYESDRTIARHFRCDVRTVARKASEWGLVKKERELPDTMVVDNVTYKRCTARLHVSRNGEFLHNGKPLKVTYAHNMNGDRATARVTADGEYYQASRLVAKVWKTNYNDGVFIIYKDENIHNICADNLVLTNREGYGRYKVRNAEFAADGLEERKRKLQNVIDEAGMTLHYMKTKDCTPLNRHVTDYLLPVLYDYCRKTLYIGESTTKRIVPDCIARLYEIIIAGCAMYNYERFCKKLLLNYKQTGTFGMTGNIPKPIEIIVETLNLNPLMEKFGIQYQHKKQKSL